MARLSAPPRPPVVAEAAELAEVAAKAPEAELAEAARAGSNLPSIMTLLPLWGALSSNQKIKWGEQED